ncbi:hypothetical protein PENSUB_928 [Penicillium subrubescens]|uniref:Uncharacterized protein n=1 Tax=Penicillium subrubescens TaxID=1316194 RepID=A0A1Q5ULF4_9EURO|nr:hypothetical protein PENSUB_928 [Penicillium subrubescens]
MKVTTVFLLCSSVLAGALAEPMPLKLATKLPELIPSGLESPNTIIVVRDNAVLLAPTTAVTVIAIAVAKLALSPA